MDRLDQRAAIVPLYHHHRMLYSASANSHLHFHCCLLYSLLNRVVAIRCRRVLDECWYMLLLRTGVLVLSLLCARAVALCFTTCGTAQHQVSCNCGRKYKNR